MLTFQQVSLSDVAPVNITRIIIGDPEIKESLTSKAATDGLIFGSKFYRARDIYIYFYFTHDDIAQKGEWIQNIIAWAHSTEPAAMRLDERPGKYINAHCNILPSLSALSRKNEMYMRFTCADPYFYDEEEKAIAIGTSFNVESIYGAKGAYITWTNPTTASSPAWVLDGSTTITISGSVAAGAVLVYLDPIYATLDGASVMDQVTLASRPFDLTYGNHTITGSGTVKFRERWI